MMNVAGLDIGFIKTGFTVFRLGPETDSLVYAETIESQHKHTTAGAASDDMDAVRVTLTKLDELFGRFGITAAFVEVPHGGAQSSRAARCMGVATGWMAAMQYFWHGEVDFELYTPGQVERALGTNLTPKQAKKLGLKHGQTTKYKKERTKLLVTAEFTHFDGWPRTKRLAEDSYDSAAAFMAGRVMNRLYRDCKELVRKDHNGRP